MTGKRKRAAGDELDKVLDEVLQAIPPELHDEMRALLRASHTPKPRKAAIALPLATPYDVAPHDEDEAPPSASPHAPLPPITPERAAQIADDIILAAMRAAGASSVTPLPAHRERGSGGEGSRGVGGEGLGKGRIVVRPDREPLGGMVRLSDVAPDPVRWLWSGRIPAGKITVLDGDPGLGKSTLLCELAARVSRGDPLPGDSEPAAPRDVLLFSAEDDVHDTIRPRIDAAGGDPHRVDCFVAIPNGTETGRPFALPSHLPLLDAVVRHVDAALVIFDPLVAYLPSGISPNSDQHVRHAMAALKASAERTGAAIVVVRHLNKSLSANPLYRGVGSIGIIGAARSGLLLAADPDDPNRRVLAVSKGNLARPAPSLVFHLEDSSGSGVARVVWEGESPWTAAELLKVQTARDGDDDEKHSAVDEARAWLREMLAAGPRPASELRREAAAQGIGYTSLTAARKAEGVKAHKERVAHGQWVWTLSVSGGEREESAPSGSSEVQTL